MKHATEKAAHTPGPWFIGDAYTDDCGQIEMPIQSVVNGNVCTPAAVVLQFPNAIGMQFANANLIAAAPELLEALIYMVDCAEFGAQPTGAPWARIQAVIAKAMGEGA